MDTPLEVELNDFYLILIALACQTWTLSRLFQRVPITANKLRNTFLSFENRMKKISSFLLFEHTRFRQKSLDRALLLLGNRYELADYFIARTGLSLTFDLFHPVYTLHSVLQKTHGVGATYVEQVRSCWIAGGHHSTKESTTEEMMAEVLFWVAAKCESRVLTTLSKFEFFASQISTFYPAL
jgi:hypothetical protein